MENLTNAQKSIWVTEQYYKGSSVNNICGTAIIEENVDFTKLEQAIKLVCKKHSNFKLRMKIQEGNIMQELSENIDCKIDFIDVLDLVELNQKRDKIVRTPFNIENNYLFKFYIFKFFNGQGAFMLNIHHLISDGWTLAFICNEIIKTYSALKQNQEIETESQYSYIDFINSEKEYIKSEKFQKDRAYWIEQFHTIPEVAIIPGSKENKGKELEVLGNRKVYQVNKNLVNKIKIYCRNNNISLYNFFMAIYGIYISEITNLDEFVIGTPILNRTNYKEKNAAGMFINMEPFKINLEGIEDFKVFVKNISIDSLNMLKHQKYSYQNLLEELREKDKNVPNLYNILLSYQITNTQMSGGNVKYKTEWTFNGCCADDIDIQIYDINDTGILNISYDYKISLYDEKDIENIHNRILYIIEQIISTENIKIKDIEIVIPEEKEKLVYEFNKTDLEYDKNIPIIKYFEQQVEKTPDNIAIVFEKQTMTYKELNEKANSLAYELRKNGVTNNTIVGIMVNRSFEMMIAILAVLKSGGCYIPIAPDYPDERIEYMLSNSKADILLTRKELINKINFEKEIIDISLKNNYIYDDNKSNIFNISKPEDLSYLIYTSGSTGKPKGVMLTQKNLSNFYNAMKKNIEYLNDGKSHKIISITTVSFDIFIFETLISLTRGLELYITNSYEQKITSKLERLIKENNIEILQTTPSVMKFHLENLSNNANFSSLKYIMLAGEQLPKQLIEKIKIVTLNCTIYNGYGPSETTIFSTTKDVTNLEKISIGKPIPNTQIFILNKNGKIVPENYMGEIYISGDGVGKGYIYRKDLTDARYLPNPYLENSIMYKTGDVGIWKEDGTIECKGRVDHQVKINGLRIELGEIEETINHYKDDNLIKSAVIVKNIDGKSTLNAFFSYPEEINVLEVKNYLLNILPSYMIPNTFTQIDKMPFTPNGKIDRKVLNNYKIDKEIKQQEISKSRNETEKIILDVIKNKLNEENFGIDNNIFDYGADSLTIINIITDLFKYNLDIKVFDMYKYPTVRELYDNLINKTENKNELEYNNFEKINKIVNEFTKEVECKKLENKYSILLTGATGFFGCHLLIELLKDYKKINKIFCIIRPRKNITGKERLLKKIEFYFGNQYEKLFEDYVEVIEGEISEKGFLLDNKTYSNLQKNVDIVIHSAANVNHYGKYSNFEKSNIIATQNIIDFCKGFDIQLHYISTMTVSGNYLLKQKNKIIEFDENSFYIGQNFEQNVYSKSKLIAESKIIENINQGLDATIYRLGDLTGRYTDGAFQENIDKNAIYLRLKSIIEIGYIPNTILENKLEFSPVDYAATAVKNIIWSDNCKNRIFNVYNPNMISTKDILKIMNKFNYKIKNVSKDEFTKIIENLSKDKEKQNSIQGIINDFTEDKDLIYNYTIKQKNNITCEYLKKLNFKWNNTDEIYLNKILEYMKTVEFIK